MVMTCMMQWEDGHDALSTTSSGKGSSYFSGEVMPPGGKDSPLQNAVSMLCMMQLICRLAMDAVNYSGTFPASMQAAACM